MALQWIKRFRNRRAEIVIGAWFVAFFGLGEYMPAPAAGAFLPRAQAVQCFVEHQPAYFEASASSS